MGRVHYEGIKLSSKAQSCRMNEKINIARYRDELSRVFYILVRINLCSIRYLYKGSIGIDENNQDPTKISVHKKLCIDISHFTRLGIPDERPAWT